MDPKPPKRFGILLSVLGLAFLAGGIKLVLIGDNLYFVFLGLGVLVSGALIASGNIAGVSVYRGTFVVIAIWSIIEVGFDTKALLGRLALLTIIGVYMSSSRVMSGFEKQMFREKPTTDNWLYKAFVLSAILAIGITILPIIPNIPLIFSVSGDGIGGTTWVCTYDPDSPDKPPDDMVVFKKNGKALLRDSSSAYMICDYELCEDGVILSGKYRGKAKRLKLIFSDEDKDVLLNSSGAEYTKQPYSRY